MDIHPNNYKIEYGIELYKVLWTLLLLLSHSVMSNSLRFHRLQHTRPPCPSPLPGVCSDSCSLSQWCHPSMSSYVVPFSSVFNLSQHRGLFQWVSSSHQVAKVLGFQLHHPVLQVKIQGWFPLGWTGWISLLSKGPSRVFSNNTVQRH